MIPSKKLSNNLRMLKENLKGIYEHTTLNKARSKYNPYGGDGFGGSSKGVESDQLLIFSPKLKGEEYTTFAIVFDYSNKPEEEHTIQLSIKPNNRAKKYYESQEEKEKRHETNKKIESSVLYSVQEFRELINKINKKINEIKINSPKDMNEEAVLELVSEIFLNKKINLKEEVDKANKEINNFLKSKVKKQEKLQEKIEEKESELKKVESTIQGSLKRTKEYIELMKLEKRQKELKEILKKKEKEYRENKGVKNLQKEIKGLKESNYQNEQEMRQGQSEILKTKPAVLKNRIRKRL